MRKENNPGTVLRMFLMRVDAGGYGGFCSLSAFLLISLKKMGLGTEFKLTFLDSKCHQTDLLAVRGKK